MEFVTQEYQLPVVRINFEDLKAELEKKLEEYTGLVVTDETLQTSKTAQKELSSMRVKIDAFRKEKKKELSAPITVFEEQCKQLVALIEKAEKPLKEGIQYYDDQKREAKREKAVEILAAVAEENGLNEKYAARLTVIDKYMNLTATEKGVREDAETRAFALKVEQDREQERIDIIQAAIDSENERITKKLSIKDFEFMFDRLPTSEIVSQVKVRAMHIYEAEHPQPKPEPKEEPKPEEQPQQEQKPQAEEPKQAPTMEKPVEQPAAEQPKAPSTYKVVLEITGTAAKIRTLADFLKTNQFDYKVISQDKI